MVEQGLEQYQNQAMRMHIHEEGRAEGRGLYRNYYITSQRIFHSNSLITALNYRKHHLYFLIQSHSDQVFIKLAKYV